MVLSIIIVNYNVRQLLAQCLESVYNAIGQDPSLPAAAEIFVVDNASTDGSREELPTAFPGVHFIWNAHNVGFGKANNQAIPLISGKYVLFLNPDTLISPDCFTRCIAFMDTHADAGALGVRMLDGQGLFLKESKRGYPSAMTSFFKLSGIAALFPGSRIFARYYLGHLSESENHPVEILSGAFMLVRKETLDKTGGFDERFFMYAEDIDLSYRITLAGYQNYYLAEASITHLKGQSTPRDRVHLDLFYQAMIQFVEKYKSGPGSGLYIFIMKSAIRFRAFIASLHL